MLIKDTSGDDDQLRQGCHFYFNADYKQIISSQYGAGNWPIHTIILKFEPLIYSTSVDIYLSYWY